MKKTLIALLLGLAAPLLRAQDADSLYFQPVSLGVIFQGNLAGERMHIEEAPVIAYPGAGAEFGGFVDYNITRNLLLEFQLIFGLQSASYLSGEQSAQMVLWGMDIPLYLIGNIPVRFGRFRVGAGPFTHLTFDVWDPSDREFETPYRRIISVDEISGKPRYALNDTHSGFGLLAGFEFENGFQINVSGKYSITDIINYQSERSYAHPYKVSFGIAYRF